MESKLISPQKHLRPGIKNGRLNVTGELNLRNIQGVDDSKMVISLEISLRMYWKDGRLTHNQTEVEEMGMEPLPRTSSPLPGSNSGGNKSYILLKDPDYIKRLWKPDIFIDQAIRVRWAIRVIKSRHLQNLTQGTEV